MAETTGASGTSASETRLTIGEELLYRQAARAFDLDDGRPNYKMFMPHTASDELSVDRSAKLTPRQAYERYTQQTGKPSFGVWPVSVEDVEGCGLKAYDDSAKPDRHDGHAYIDFKDNPGESRNQRDIWRRTKADNLARCAARRGPALNV